MVKNGPNSVRHSTSTLSLRPSTAESQSRQQIADLEARIAALMRLQEDAERATVRESTTARHQLPRPVFCDSRSPNVRADNPEWDPRESIGPRLRAYAERRAIEKEEENQQSKSLFEKYNETLQEQHQRPKGSLITKGLIREENSLKSPEAYTQPFCDFLTENPTVWHAVDYFQKKLEKAGFKKVCSLHIQRDLSNICSFLNVRPGTTSSKPEANTSCREMEVL